MIKAFAGRCYAALLPGWARPDHPALRYTIQRDSRQRSRTASWLVRAISVGVLAALLVVSFQAANGGAPIAVPDEEGTALFRVLYFPLLTLQLFAMMAAMVMTSHTVSMERARGTWEPVKITSHGAEVTIRARWAAVFYRMRWLLLVMMLPRVVLIGQMVADLADYQGHHLDLYITGISPEVSAGEASLLLAALMTAALLLPLVIVGLNAAAGLLISTLFCGPRTIQAVRLMILLLEVGLSLAALGAGRLTLDRSHLWGSSGQLGLDGDWYCLLYMGTLGDLCLRFLDLRTYFQVWVDIKNGVLLGAAILAVMALLALLTHGMLALTVRLAGRPSRE
ncbi:MAG: hypothetical protein JXJ20_14180 [Anaerolineae bacterium]|nr:hypothetical protein [Anaerolineae bacterium]